MRCDVVQFFPGRQHCDIVKDERMYRAVANFCVMDPKDSEVDGGSG